MNLYIQIENGQPIKHPATEENLLQAFGSIPSNWSPFNRIQLSDSGVTIGVYQNAVNTYTLNLDGVMWQDTWTAVDMTPDEKSVKVEQQTTNANQIIANLKRNAETIISSLTDQSQIEVWNTYVSLLNEVTFTDPTQITIPKMPKKDGNGNYIANIDENNIWQTRTFSG